MEPIGHFNGERLRSRRIAMGLTLEDLAVQIGVTFSTVSAWEREVRTPQVQNLIDLCIFFQVSADWLLSLSDNPYSLIP